MWQIIINLNLDAIKKNFYLIVPTLCVFLWALFYLITQNFIIHQGDFKGDFFILYNTSKLLFDEPENL